MSIDYSAMAFPKGKKKKRKKHPKSIMHPEGDKHCFLCMMRGNRMTHQYLETHHVIFGSGKRQISEEYGLTVRLCPLHHRTGSEAVHNNKKNADKLKRIAQERFEETYPNLDWMEVVGKNYK